MVYKRTPCALLLFTVICLLFPIVTWAIGLEVDPVEIKLRNCPLGKKIAVSELGGKKMELRIENKSDSAYTYTIDILTSPGRATPLKEGYVDIPDTSWLWPESKEVRIAGKSTKSVELYLKIPRSKRYYDKKYQAIIEVKSKKNRPEEMFVLAVQLRLCLSTIKKGVKR